MKAPRSGLERVRRGRCVAGLMILVLAALPTGAPPLLAPAGSALFAPLSGATQAGRGMRPAAVIEREILATADATMAAEEPDRNFRLAPELMVHHAPAFGSVAEQIKFSLLQFSDLSAIPAGSQLQYAWLRLKLLGANGAAAGSINTCAIEGPWSDATVTWNNPPLMTSNTFCEGWQSVPGTPGEVQLPATRIVGAWLADSRPNHGILLTPDQGLTFLRRFESRDRGLAPSFVPRLVVGIMPPPPLTGSLRSEPKGCSETGGGAYQINDSFTVTYGVTGPPSGHVRVRWFPQVGAVQTLDERDLAQDKPISQGPFRFTAADAGLGRFQLEGIVEQAWQTLATCSVSVSEEPPPSPPPAGSPYDFGNLRIWADSFTVKRVATGKTPPADNWVFTARGNVRLGSAVTNRSYLTVPVELDLPVPGASAGNFPVDSPLDFPTLGGPPVSFERRVFTVDKLCRLSGSFVGQVPIHDSTALKVSASDTRVSAQLCPNGAEPPGLKGQGRMNLSLPENADLKLDLSFAVREKMPGTWTWSGASTGALALKLAGGQVDGLTGQVALTDEGLVASNVAYRLPLVYPASIKLDRLLIGRDGRLALRGPGGAAEAPLPDWNLGGDYGIRMRAAKARAEVEDGRFILALTACVELRLPGNSAFTPVQADCRLELTVRDGSLGAGLPAFRLPAAGRDLALGPARLERREGAGPLAYRLVVDEADWDLAADWGAGAAIHLEDLVIQTVSPYLSLGAGALEATLDQRFALGGGDPGQAAAAFHLQRLKLELQAGRLTALLEADLTLRIGTEASAALTLRLADGRLVTETAVAVIVPRLAGLDLQLGGVRYADGRLTAESARLDLPAGWTDLSGAEAVAVEGVSIGRDGLDVAALRIDFGPQKLGETVALKDIAVQAALDRVEEGLRRYRLDLAACISVQLPGGEVARFDGDCRVRLSVVSGYLATLTLPDLSLPVAGLPMRFRAPELAVWGGSGSKSGVETRRLAVLAEPSGPSDAIDGYRISAKDVSWDLPAEWGAGSFSLSQVEIFSAAPFLRAGGAAGTVRIDRSFGLGGAGEEAVASFRVDNLALAFAGGKARGRLDCHLTLRIGREASAAAVLLLEDGRLQLDGSIERIEPLVGGLTLRLEEVAYRDERVTAGRATLLLPADWLGGSAEVTELSIDKDGLSIGGAGFGVPDQDFGAVRLEGLSGAVVNVSGTELPRRYRVDLAGKAVLVADLVRSVGGRIHFHPDGRVDGEIDDFRIAVVGFGLEVKGATFDRDHVYAERAGLSLPEALSSLNGHVSAEVTALTLDRDGVRVGGGGFELAFETGGVGFSGQARFEPDPADKRRSIVAMQAEAGTPQLDLAVGVTIGWKDPDVELRRIYVAIEGTPPEAPTVLLEPHTQLYAYKLSGEMVLTDARQSLALDGYARSLTTVFGAYLLEAHGGVDVEWSPGTYLLLRGDARLLGQNVGEASLKLTPESVWLAGKLTASGGPAKIEAALKAAMGKDPAGDFTMMAQMGATLYIKEDAVCWGVPWSDIKLADAEASLGKHRHKDKPAWGLRASAGIKHIGRGYAWIGFSPKGAKVGKGSGEKSYTPIWPAGVALAGLSASPHDLAREAAAERGERLAAPTAAGRGSFSTGELADFLLVEYLAPETGLDAPTVQLTQPDGTALMPPLADSSERHHARYYLVEAPPAGLWQVEAAPGSYVAVLGAPAALRVRQASIAGAAAPYRIAWDVAAEADAELSLQLRPETGEGQALVIAQDLPAAGGLDWTPGRLAAGRYVVELVVEEETQAAFHAVGTIDWVDAAPPGMPRDLQASLNAGGQLLATWSPPADEDVAGYEITLGQGKPQRRMGEERTRFVSTGFNPADVASLRVAAVDLSGNLGPAATVEARWMAGGPAVQSFAPRDGDRRVGAGGTAVEVRFREVVRVTDFAVRDPGGRALVGSWAVLDPAAAAPARGLAARWTADVPLDTPGRYEARVLLRDAREVAHSVGWSWTIVGLPAPPRLFAAYLPALSQTGRPWPGGAR